MRRDNDEMRKCTILARRVGAEPVEIPIRLCTAPKPCLIDDRSWLTALTGMRRGQPRHAVDLHSLRAGSLARDDHVLCIRRQIPGS